MGEIEIWKTIENYNNYFVSNLGKIKLVSSKGKSKEKILKCYEIRGYVVVRLTKNHIRKFIRVKDLVGFAFLKDRPTNFTRVKNINDDKTDNRVENLCWHVKTKKKPAYKKKNIIHCDIDKNFIDAWEHLIDTNNNLNKQIKDIYAKYIKKYV